MNFSLLELLLLLIPLSFFGLWVSDRQQLAPIEWKQFSVSALENCAGQGKAAFVYCRPKGNTDIDWSGAVEHPALLRHHHAGHLEAFQFNYDKETEFAENWSKETKWMMNACGSSRLYNSLFMVSPDGQIDINLRYSPKMQLEFFELSSIGEHRSHLLFSIFAISLIAIVCMIFRQRRRASEQQHSRLRRSESIELDS